MRLEFVLRDRKQLGSPAVLPHVSQLKDEFKTNKKEALKLLKRVYGNA